MLSQWFLKITDYADELLEGLETIDWPEKTKSMQRNWIGKSKGAEVRFKIDGFDEELDVFTTRPDTLFGVTYMVLAPENELVDKLTTEENKQAVEDYKQKARELTEIERTSTVKEKTGVPTGSYAINPVNNERVPIWISDYVLLSYGTGAVMAVPGHDERDFEFASKFNLPIRKVILEPGEDENEELTEAFTGEGTMINSGEFTGMNSAEGIEKISKFLEEKDLGRPKINYRLRDWLISRQRYWGTPIPIIYCEKCGEQPVAEEDLPVELPYDVDFRIGGGSPLAKSEDFVNTKCPKCGGDAKREVDTMDTFVDSSWYYLRFLNPDYEQEIFDKELATTWTPVDMYVGGAEHATMHLLYARFIHKFLRDIGKVNSDEPFQKLIHQGTITNEGAKMSKSKGNVVIPDDFITDYGADVFRMYLMFMGPYDLGGDWSDKGIKGVDRFVQKIYASYEANKDICKNFSPKEKYELNKLTETEQTVYRKVNQTIEKYNDELDNFRFNTAVASLMELQNEFNKNLENCGDEIKAYALMRTAPMIAPLAPHLGEECWNLIGNEDSLFSKPVFFEPDKDALTVESTTIVVQVNGKVRTKLDMPVDEPEEAVKDSVWADEKVKKHTEGKSVVKEIYVKNKIYNIVVK
jgi:leucyl-tRNA synthetase